MGGLDPIRIGHLKIADHLVLGAAENSYTPVGWDQSRPLFQSLPMTRWDQIAHGLLEETVDAAFLPAPLALNLFGRGAGIRLTLLGHRGGSRFVTSRSVKIQKLSDFKGRSILISSLYSVNHILLHRLFTAAGLTMGTHREGKEVTLEEMPPELMSEALSLDHDGIIGGVMAEEPFGSLAVIRKTAISFCSSSRLWPGHMGSVLVFRDEILARRAGEAGCIVQAFFKAGKRLHRDDRDALAAAALFLDQPGTLLGEAESECCYDPDLLMPGLGELEVIQDYLVDQMGLMEARVSLPEFVEARFAQEISVDSLS